MKKISVSESHSSLMADFFREEERKLLKKLEELRDILAQLTGETSNSKGDAAKSSEVDAPAANPKRGRGRPKGTGKKRGRKPKAEKVTESPVALTSETMVEAPKRGRGRPKGSTSGKQKGGKKRGRKPGVKNAVASNVIIPAEAMVEAPKKGRGRPKGSGKKRGRKPKK